MKKAIKKMVDRLTDVGDLRFIYALLRKMLEEVDNETLVNDIARLEHKDTVKQAKAMKGGTNELP